MKKTSFKSKQIGYDHKKNEAKWQKKWLEEGIYTPDLSKAKKPFYNLMMFPYPSAEGLHVGNMYAFTGADVYGRFQRMSGYDVFEPIGLDGFGIHSENYAIKVGVHPKDHAKKSEKHFYDQLHKLGNSYDWTRTLETYDPSYYRWTQWLFVKLFKAGLAYKNNAMVNWCPSCKTVLSDEQVIDGKCERCGTEVIRREMSSWFFKITNYSDRLLNNIEGLKWPDKIKIAQRQWIGKSKGLTISFPLPVDSLPTTVRGSQFTVDVWTKFWETIYGVTFIVVSPEYAKENLLDKVPQKYAKDVIAYINLSLNKSDQERKEITEKSGAFTGIYAINPVNGSKVPIFVADYVLAGVGTGAVMGVPAHDERDFEFVKKYGLNIIQVVSYKNTDLNNKVSNKEVAHEGYIGNEILINSDKFNGLNASGKGKEKIAEWLIEEGFARWETNYHLRDWLISRQRYWGPPIPMINCKDCGWQAVPEDDLPVLLPDIKEFKPQGDGTSPLHNAPESWKKVNCPNCGKFAERELDVSDTFLDSSWYFLRYPSVDAKSSTSLPFDIEITKKWLPLNAYIGGAEHAVLHLLYSRFVTMFLKDQGYLNFDEPFPFFFGHGLIIKDGAKMSKSKGNVVNPDEYIEKFGADTLRTYLMFLGPFDQGGDFRDTGIEGMGRFLGRVRRLFDNFEAKPRAFESPGSAVAMTIMHKTIKKVTEDISKFKYNTAISVIMEYVNFLTEHRTPTTIHSKNLEVLLQLMAPFAPFLTEELWQKHFSHNQKLTTHNFSSIHLSSWPEYDEKYLISDEVTIIVQVNGKLRGQFTVSREYSQNKDKMIELAKEDQKVSEHLKDQKILKEIFVPGKLVNFVV